LYYPQVDQADCGYESRTDIEFHRLLLPDAPLREYRRRRGELKTVIHWGQRKLLLAEIEFLTKFGVPGATVVYAGAAPGTHSQYLIELFPELKFVLVDPAPFSSKLTEGPRCLLRQELFTDDVAQEYAGRDKVLFVCDIRSCDYTLISDPKVEDKVLEDMQAQQRWHDIIQPIKSLLKFRLPWKPGCTEYLAGDVYLQAFGPTTTTETRLVPHGHGRVMWDNKKYEAQMFYFNTVTRVARYAHSMPVGRPGYGLDYCYDCRAEVQILSEYLRKYNPELQGVHLRDKFCEMTCRCSRENDFSRTLMDANSDPDEKTAGIRSRQWIKGRPAYYDAKRQEEQPVYSQNAKAMMLKIDYKQGSGLGPQGQGAGESITDGARFRRKGLGMDLHETPPSDPHEDPLMPRLKTRRVLE
jgi:cap2 methyltransferase